MMIRQEQLDAVGPWFALMAMMLCQARKDATRGSLSALTWLVDVGIDWVSSYGEDLDLKLLEFCHEVRGRIESGQLEARE